jgi:hypothetical protein
MLVRELVFAGLLSLTGAPADSSETAPCETGDARRAIEQPVVQPPAPQAPSVTLRRVGREDAVASRTPPRRRNGKPIPDAELIGPRGAL